MARLLFPTAQHSTTNATTTLNGDFNWNGGTINGSGQLVTTGTSTLGGVALHNLTNIIWNNSGTVNWNSGDLSAVASTLTNTGSFNANAGALLTLDATSVFDNQNSFNVTGATTTINGAFNQSNVASTLSGTGDLIINGPFNWTAGSISGSGLLTTNGTSTINNVAGLTLSRNWTNAGTVNWSSGNLSIFSSRTFTNTGTFNANAATTLSLGAGSKFDNQSDFNINSNTTISGAGLFQQNVSTGRVLLNNANLTVSTLTLSDGTLGGNGIIIGNVNNVGGTVQPGGAGATGILTINGNYTQGTAGTLEIELNGISPGIGPGTHDQLVINGSGVTALLAGTVNISLLGGYTPAILDKYQFISVIGSGSVVNGFGTVIKPADFSVLDYPATGKSVDIVFVGTATGIIWNGGVGDWEVPTNWIGSIAPVIGDNVLIPVNSTVSINLFEDVNTVTLAAGSSLILNAGGLNLASDSTFDGTFTVSGGTFTTNGTTTVNGNFNWNGGTIDGNGTGQLVTNGLNTLTGTTHNLANIIWNNNGSVNWNSGDIVQTAATLTNNGTFVANAGATLSLDSSSGFANQNIVNINADTTVSGAGSFQQNAGQLVITDATLTIPTLTISNGEVIINGTVDGDVSNDGVLSGSGTVTGNVTNAGEFNPGGSPGTFSIGGDLTLLETSVLNIDIAGLGKGTEYDEIAVAGNVAFNGTLNVIVDESTGYVAAIGDSFDPVSYASSSGTVALTSTLGYDYELTFEPTKLNLSTSFIPALLTLPDAQNDIVVLMNITKNFGQFENINEVENELVSTDEEGEGKRALVCSL